MTNTEFTITYRSGEKALTLTYLGDECDFFAVGFEPSDELLLKAAEAEGLDFEIDDESWVSEW